MKECNHKWIDLEDGSCDKFCVRCCKRAKQAFNYLHQPEIKINIKLEATTRNDDLINELSRKIANGTPHPEYLK